MQLSVTTYVIVELLLPPELLNRQLIYPKALRRYSDKPTIGQQPASNRLGASEYLATKSLCTEMVAGISPCPFMTMREVTILSRHDKGANAAMSRSHSRLKQHFV
jgi:hypothetical protein